MASDIKSPAQGAVEAFEESSVVVKNTDNKMESRCSLRYYRGEKLTWYETLQTALALFLLGKRLKNI